MLDVFFSHHWHKSVSTLSIVRSQGESVCLHNMWKFHVFIIQKLQRRLSGVTYTWAPVLLWHALTPCSPGGVKKVCETLFPYLFPTYRESVERRRYDVPFRPSYGCFFVPHQPLNDAGKLVSLETAQHSTEAGLLSRRHFSKSAHAHKLRDWPPPLRARAARMKKLYRVGAAGILRRVNARNGGNWNRLWCQMNIAISPAQLQQLHHLLFSWQRSAALAHHHHQVVPFSFEPTSQHALLLKNRKPLSERHH